MDWPFAALPMFGFDALMVDPPWHFDLYSESGGEKSPQAQYVTMSLAEIEALPVGDLCGAGGVLWLWCTWPLVARGDHAAIMRRWGFLPVTGGAWAKRTAAGKLRWGTGYVLRSLCEPFIVGVLSHRSARGTGCVNFIETVESAVVDGIAREHSRKPDEAYTIMEALTPGARRADLFARQERPGWTAWGNETTKFGAAA